MSLNQPKRTTSHHSEKLVEYLIKRNKIISDQYYNGKDINDTGKADEDTKRPMVQTNRPPG